MSLNYGNSISAVASSLQPVLTINSNTALTASAYGKTYKVTGAYTVTLPSISSGSSGLEITLLNDSSSATVTIVCQGSDLIRVVGTNTATISLLPGDSTVIQNTGSSFSLADSNPIKASLNSPALTGTPTSTTAAVNTNTTQIATTAFVVGQASNLTPNALSAVAAPGSSNTMARGDHTHPNTTLTQTAGDATTAIATTAFVATAVANASPTQIQALSASVSGNALTVNSVATKLDFRNATLTNGAPISSVAVGSLSITIPSTATLGTVSGQSARLYVLVAYNGGSPVLCVVNGLAVDESSLISPTTISTSATAAKIIYSSTAVSVNSPFRVLGFVDITEATAGTWATAPTLIQGQGGTLSPASLGFGQTWQNVTGSRALSTTYVNTTGKPIAIHAVSAMSGGGVGDTSLIIDGVQLSSTYSSSSNQKWDIFGIVPNGSSYYILMNNGMGTWLELR